MTVRHVQNITRWGNFLENPYLRNLSFAHLSISNGVTEKRAKEKQTNFSHFLFTIFRNWHFIRQYRMNKQLLSASQLPNIRNRNIEKVWLKILNKVNVSVVSELSKWTQNYPDSSLIGHFRGLNWRPGSIPEEHHSRESERLAKKKKKKSPSLWDFNQSDWSISTDW